MGHGTGAAAEIKCHLPYHVLGRISESFEGFVVIAMDEDVLCKGPLHGASARPLKGSLKRLKQIMESLNDGLIFMGGAVSALLLVWVFWRIGYTNSSMEMEAELSVSPKCPDQCFSDGNSGTTGRNRVDHSVDEWEKSSENFYNNPEVTYTIGQPIRDWDRKRKLWLDRHPQVKNFTDDGKPRVLMVSGSQAIPCRNPIGDHLLLRFFKNKVDYCRLHGIDIFYNNVLLEEHMTTFWAKIPLVRAAMVAHPEAEWIWWMDSDAAITDMDFVIPWERYRDYNLVVHGWDHLVYEKRSWVSLNAGIFLIRNCEWSIEFLERWSVMGPQSPLFVSSGKLLSKVLSDRAFNSSDDQSALVYLLLKEKDKWADRIFIEHKYYLNGYWLDIVGTYENITEKYEAMEKENPMLNKRHAEKMNRDYAEMREHHMRDNKNFYSDNDDIMVRRRRPFVTHFTGCQPCSGDHNKIYKGENCWKGMERALNFADDQVLKNYGFRHDNLQSSHVNPIQSFYFPS